jgi:hypothetical protein
MLLFTGVVAVTEDSLIVVAIEEKDDEEDECGGIQARVDDKVDERSDNA